MRMRRVLVLAALTFAAGAARAQIVERIDRTWSLNQFVDEDGDPAEDISGIACTKPSPSGDRQCIVANDENSFVQWGAFRDLRIAARGERVALAGAGAPAPIGTPPQLGDCPGGRKVGEFDAEAVALDERYFYVLGSHGCSRNKGRANPSAFLLARIPASGFGKAGGAETTHRFSEALRAHPKLLEHFGRQLENRSGLPQLAGPNGLNLEGAAIVQGRLVAGLRAPVVGGKAFIVSTPVDDLFDPRKPLESALIEVDLGGRSIRDLAADQAGHLIAIAGPAQGEAGDFALYRLAPDGGPVKLLGALPPGAKGAKAEALLVLEQDAEKMRVLVLFDSIKGGGPREYEVAY